MNLTAVILTFNEEQHLSRCLAGLSGVVTDVVVADCYSTDATLEIAHAHGAEVIQNEWVNHAVQFNWALTQLDEDIDWILRIDADEVLSPELAEEIQQRLAALEPSVNGVYCGRSMTFLGEPIHWGGVFPIRVLRLFRHGHGKCENRWMDEHIKVVGDTVVFDGEIIDDNLNSLTWWTDKHNKYASREAVELLNLKYGFMDRDSVGTLRGGLQAGVKRWVKESVYARMPGGFRAFLYFFYRYVIRLGFLDGRVGFAFHFLQGFWYRYLVDAKVDEVEQYIDREGVDAVTAIDRILEIKL